MAPQRGTCGANGALAAAGPASPPVSVARSRSRAPAPLLDPGGEGLVVLVGGLQVREQGRQLAGAVAAERQQQAERRGRHVGAGRWWWNGGLEVDRRARDRVGALAGFQPSSSCVGIDSGRQPQNLDATVLREMAVEAERGADAATFHDGEGNCIAKAPVLVGVARDHFPRMRFFGGQHPD